jgi:branched-subunit amino acid aminotransferase/4-amino-4-deoxychorismate lyase
MSKVGSRVWFNGALRDANDISWAQNRAFRYGDGLIETMRMLRGELLFFHDHIERMLHGAHELMLPVPSHWDAKFFYDRITQVLTANAYDASARIRIQLWRTGEGLHTPIHQGVDFIIETTEAKSEYTYNDTGLKAVVVNGIRKTYDRLANVKTSSALSYVLAAIEAQQQKADVGLVLNDRGTIADAVGRNVFILEKGKVVTPPLTDAGVAGVFRLQLMQLVRSHGIVMLEASITPERLGDADEIFVTNVTDGIQPISQFNGKSFPTQQTKELYRLFRNHLLHAE